MIDELDKQLIMELQKDGRQSYIELSKKLNVSEGTVRRRLNILTRKELIRVVAEVNVRKLGYNIISAIVIHLEPAHRSVVAEKLAAIPEICYLASVTGSYDLIAIVVTKSSEELGKCAEEKISQVPGVLRLEICVNLNIAKGIWPSFETSQLVNQM